MHTMLGNFACAVEVDHQWLLQNLSVLIHLVGVRFDGMFCVGIVCAIPSTVCHVGSPLWCPAGITSSQHWGLAGIGTCVHMYPHVNMYAHACT